MSKRTREDLPDEIPEAAVDRHSRASFKTLQTYLHRKIADLKSGLPALQAELDRWKHIGQKAYDINLDITALGKEIKSWEDKLELLNQARRDFLDYHMHQTSSVERPGFGNELHAHEVKYGIQQRVKDLELSHPSWNVLGWWIPGLDIHTYNSAEFGAEFLQRYIAVTPAEALGWITHFYSLRSHVLKISLAKECDDSNFSEYAGMPAVLSRSYADAGHDPSRITGWDFIGIDNGDPFTIIVPDPKTVSHESSVVLSPQLIRANARELLLLFPPYRVDESATFSYQRHVLDLLSMHDSTLREAYPYNQTMPFKWTRSFYWEAQMYEKGLDHVSQKYDLGLLLQYAAAAHHTMWSLDLANEERRAVDKRNSFEHELTLIRNDKTKPAEYKKDLEAALRKAFEQSGFQGPRISHTKLAPLPAVSSVKDANDSRIDFSWQIALVFATSVIYGGIPKDRVDPRIRRQLRSQLMQTAAAAHPGGDFLDLSNAATRDEIQYAIDNPQPQPSCEWFDGVKNLRHLKHYFAIFRWWCEGCARFVKDASLRSRSNHHLDVQTWKLMWFLFPEIKPFLALPNAHYFQLMAPRNLIETVVAANGLCDPPFNDLRKMSSACILKTEAGKRQLDVLDSLYSDESLKKSTETVAKAASAAQSQQTASNNTIAALSTAPKYQVLPKVAEVIQKRAAEQRLTAMGHTRTAWFNAARSVAQHFFHIEDLDRLYPTKLSDSTSADLHSVIAAFEDQRKTLQDAKISGQLELAATNVVGQIDDALKAEKAKVAAWDSLADNAKQIGLLLRSVWSFPQGDLRYPLACLSTGRAISVRMMAIVHGFNASTDDTTLNRRGFFEAVNQLAAVCPEKVTVEWEHGDAVNSTDTVAALSRNNHAIVYATNKQLRGIPETKRRRHVLEYLPYVGGFMDLESDHIRHDAAAGWRGALFAVAYALAIAGKWAVKKERFVNNYVVAMRVIRLFGGVTIPTGVMEKLKFFKELNEDGAKCQHIIALNAVNDGMGCIKPGWDILQIPAENPPAIGPLFWTLELKEFLRNHFVD